MNFHSKYAEFYDLFYHDKDYAAEAGFVLELAAQAGIKPGRLLDLGSGTGRHAIEWARSGIEVHGVERSQEMLVLANKRVPDSCRQFVTFSQGDIRNLEVADKSCDLVTAMFAVLGYITDQDDLVDLLRRIRRTLSANGLFICDTWSAAAVYKDGPRDRLTVAKGPEGSLYRFARSQLDIDKQVVTVHYTLIDSGNPLNSYEEEHKVRFFSPAEMGLLARAAGMELIFSCPFLKKDSRLGLMDWNASWVFKNTCSTSA